MPESDNTPENDEFDVLSDVEQASDLGTDADDESAPASAEAEAEAGAGAGAGAADPAAAAVAEVTQAPTFTPAAPPVSPAPASTPIPAPATETPTGVIGTQVLRELTGGVLTITLNRPEAANAINSDQRDALIGLFDEASVDPEVRVVVLAANGRHFCSGADVGGLNPSAQRHVIDTVNRITNGAQRLVTSILDCGKPVIAVVQGTAAGMGAHLAFAADLVVASDKASFIESFVLRGLVVDAGGAYLLPRRIGLQKAKELAFLGDKLPAAEAAALGLVNRVVPAEDLDKTVAELAGRLAVAATSSITLTKKLLNNSLDHARADALLAEAMAQEVQGRSEDATEGVRAFKERRSPDYKGW